MTAKRFIIINESALFSRVLSDEFPLWIIEQGNIRVHRDDAQVLVEFLNEWHEEIMKLNDECAKHLADKIKDYEQFKEVTEENKQLKKDLIDHSALISMLEDYQALKIEDTLWNLTGAESEEEFNELYKPYLEQAKQNWSGGNK